MNSMPTESELSRRIGRAFLEIEGLAEGLEESIHPDDEMFHTARLAEAAHPGRSRLQYYRDGQEVVHALKNMLDAAGRPLAGCDRLLEMACGYGRVTRHLVRELPAANITSVEILEPAVEFVGQTMGVDARTSCTDPSRLNIGSDFDVILVSSLFSHLPRARFGEWLQSLYGLLSPRGVLVFSAHGPEAVPEIAKDPSGFTFVPQSESLNLDSAEYGSAFVTPDMVREIAREEGLAHIAFVERDLWMLQDLYVVSRVALPGLSAWQNVSFVQGVIDRVQIQEGEFAIDGWAADSRRGVPMQSVRLLVDGQEVASVEVKAPRADVARLKGRPDWAHSGWSLHGRLPELASGEHLLAAEGVSTTGATGVLDILPVQLP
jgi:SAM-dependent methyltransferase